MQAQRLYWMLLHTSIKRLYAITFSIIIGILCVWLYFWYLPINRSIHRLLLINEVQSSSVNTNVNINACVVVNESENLTALAAFADQAGVTLHRCKRNNGHTITLEAQGTVTQLISFFEILQCGSHSFECTQMRVNRDCKDLCNVRIELS